MFKIYPGFWTQIILMSISLTGLILYYFAFRIGSKRKAEDTFVTPNLLYYMGSLTCIIWLIMPFLKQPRFPGFIEVIQGGSVSIIGLITSIFGLCITISFFIWDILSTKVNFKVTKNNYFAPKKLLTNGIYSIVRHPMIISDFFLHFGLCLCTGAYYTTMLLPVYFILNHCFVRIQEKYSLEPIFLEKYEEYKKTTPGYFTWWLMLVLILGVAAVVANFARVRIVINEEVATVAKSAQCHEFIERLPNGYNTVIGEGGATLSGGEKQRVSIARAILKDAPIVILDEATAYVDPENEILIQKAINSLVRFKTLIIIAHRLSTITSADQILVMDQGKVVERGKHSDLVVWDGLYRKLWERRQRARGWKIAKSQ
jgi:protein-S-isoprenylcysteine O-methyltransferase Ste14